MKQKHYLGRLLTSIILMFFSASVYANDAELARIQAQLNKEVLEKPFSVADEKKISQYMKDAMAKDLKPEVTQAPKGWQPGWTCRNVYSYGWRTYRNCRYYRHYYGYYW